MIFHTGFSGGGWIRDEPKDRLLRAPHGFSAPEYIDSRSYCLPANHQGVESICAGVAVAGYVEVQRWKETHIAQQVDGREIYSKAHKWIPAADGTTLEYAFKAAQALGYYTDRHIEYFTTKKDLTFALHSHTACVVGMDITDNWNKTNVKTGWIGEGDDEKIGGHAVLACWYDDDGFGWQNSWSGRWGVDGFGRMRWSQFDKEFVYGAVLV